MGASMGRHSDPLDNFTRPVHLERLRMVDGDYDEGGAYWGGGGKPVFCVWDDDGHANYFRAKDSNEARRMLPWAISSPKNKGKKSSSEDAEILTGMARGPWVMHWAREQEEAGESLSGVDVYEAAPSTPRSAVKWAAELGRGILAANHATSLEQLYQAAVAAGFAKDRETFGYYLGAQATGEGVSWDDDVSGSDLKIQLPHSEYYG